MRRDLSEERNKDNVSPVAHGGGLSGIDNRENQSCREIQAIGVHYQ